MVNQIMSSYLEKYDYKRITRLFLYETFGGIVPVYGRINRYRGKRHAGRFASLSEFLLASFGAGHKTIV
jgi:hypothetical protein